MQQEIFYLAYHLHWSWSEIMALDIGKRRTYVRMLAERITAENETLEELKEQLK